MDVIFSSNSGMSREQLLAYLVREKAADPGLTIVDIGGAFNPWTAEVADCFVDMRPVAGHDTIVGDVHDPALWREIRARRFGFCICSHVLEDIRDPVFVLAQLRETFSRGYIAVPNKHVEFNHIESRHYVGYGHHRWIYTLTDDELRVVAKFPFASYFSPKRRALQKFNASAPLNVLRRWFGVTPRVRHLGALDWWNSSLSERGNELAFIWQGELSFQVVNSDYAGESLDDLARLYRDELAHGL
jgi:hypothetical protein